MSPARLSESRAPEILFEDAHLIVLSKPTGMLSQGEITGSENLVDWLRAYLGRHYVGLIHRLDRNTSGVMVVAKRTKSAQRLSASLEKGEIARSYLAWVQGELRLGQPPLRWRHFLVKDEKLNVSRVVDPAKDQSGKEAILAVRPVLGALVQGEAVTLTEFVLETGRSHQIRAQAAHEGHPLVGDVKYGGMRTQLISRPALHSYHIEFPHPMGGQKMILSAALPEDFRSIAGSSLSDIDLLLKKAGSEMCSEARPPS